MATIAAARKSRPRNAFEDFALTAILQSSPTFAAAALLLKLCGSHDLVGDPGVAIFVVFASLIHAVVMVTLAATGCDRAESVGDGECGVILIRRPPVVLTNGTSEKLSKVAQAPSRRGALNLDGNRGIHPSYF